jgi:hypothetical protein
LSISEDADEDAVADGAAGSDDADRETDENGTLAPTAAKWGMAGLLLVYAGLGSYAVVSALGVTPSHLEGVTRSTATALAGPAAHGAGGAAPLATDAAAVAAAKSYAARAYAVGVAANPSVDVSSAPRLEVLTAVSATAIGPLGASDGDHPQLAQYVLDPQSGTSWLTHWYASAHFGALKEGTGLLLDMGRVVTIRQVQLALAGGPGFQGADVEIRIGDTPDLANAKPVAVAYGVGGWVMQKLSSPATGRYVQIWFTKLPLDSSGTYQEHVYGVTVHGSVPGHHRTPARDTSGRHGGHDRGDGGYGRPGGRGLRGFIFDPGHGGFDHGGGH